MIYFFVGTTAELIKLFPVMINLNERGLEYKIISSGQNDLTDSEIIRQFKLKSPEIYLSDTGHKKTAFGLFNWFLKTILVGLVRLKPLRLSKNDVMVVHGDTVSTVLGALLAKAFGMKVAHIEAGLRSYNFFNPFPEELDRVITSRLSDIHFAPGEWAIENLKQRKGVKIDTIDNTLIDSLSLTNKISVTTETLDILQGQKYFVLVLHRQENLFDEKFVRSIIDRCSKEAKKLKCVLVLHDLTRIKLVELGLLKQLEDNSQIILVPRLPYVEFMKVLRQCQYMVTDGGSNQEEAFYLGKPCLLLRTHTERREGLGLNAILSEKDSNIIDGFFRNIVSYNIPKRNFINSPSQIIVDTLEKYHNSRN